ncbi:cytochrome C [bacterium]|nr:MAG: cytochrome C [bacterium]
MRRVFIVLLILITAIQFLRPERSNIPEDPAKNIQSYVKVPDEITKILIRSCYDCHSNTTRWPWYSEIAPFSWVIADDVKLGRRHLNFSEWGTYSQKRMGKKLYQIAEVAGDSSMPLTSYRLTHPDAKLSSMELKMLGTWAEEKADEIPDSDDDYEEGTSHK